MTNRMLESSNYITHLVTYLNKGDKKSSVSFLKHPSYIVQLALRRSI